MGDNLALKAVRGASRNTFLFALIGVIVAGVVGAILILPYWLGTLNPKPISNQDLLANNLSPDVYGAQVTGELMLDTGYYYEYKLYGIVTTSRKYYGALVIDSNAPKFLLVENGSVIDESILNYTGTLTGISSDVNREIVQDIYSDVPDLRGAFLPMMLKTSNDELNITTVFFAVFGAVALFFLVRSVQRLINPHRHPFIQALSKYGDPQLVSEQINGELLLGADNKVGKLQLTRSWFLFANSTNFRAMKFADTVWVYQHVTENKQYGVTTNRVYEARFYDRHGNEIKIVDKEEAVNTMLSAVAERAPHATIGYNSQLEDLWKKGATAFSTAQRNAPAEA